MQLIVAFLRIVSPQSFGRCADILVARQRGRHAFLRDFRDEGERGVLGGSASSLEDFRQQSQALTTNRGPRHEVEDQGRLQGGQGLFRRLELLRIRYVAASKVGLESFELTLSSSSHLSSDTITTSAPYSAPYKLCAIQTLRHKTPPESATSSLCHTTPPESAAPLLFLQHTTLSESAKTLDFATLWAQL